MSSHYGIIKEVKNQPKSSTVPMKSCVRKQVYRNTKALQVKINNNWTNSIHFMSCAAVMKQNCEATIQFGKNDMINVCVCVWGGGMTTPTYVTSTTMQNLENVNKNFCVSYKISTVKSILYSHA
jgi:hypothetical protein